MKLYDRLNEIEKNHELNKHLKLRVYCTDSDMLKDILRVTQMH